MYINVAQPDGNPIHINVTLSNDYVLMTTAKEQILFSKYEADLFGRMILQAAGKLD